MLNLYKQRIYRKLGRSKADQMIKQKVKESNNQEFIRQIYNQYCRDYEILPEYKSEISNDKHIKNVENLEKLILIKPKKIKEINPGE
jgi:hypothetical protein